MPQKYKEISSLEVENVGTIKPGSTLEHPKFGLGEVVELALFDSGRHSISVNFEKCGRKALDPEYAKFKSVSRPKIEDLPEKSIIGKFVDLFK